MKPVISASWPWATPETQIAAMKTGNSRILMIQSRFFRGIGRYPRQSPIQRYFRFDRCYGEIRYSVTSPASAIVKSHQGSGRNGPVVAIISIIPLFIGEKLIPLVGSLAFDPKPDTTINYEQLAVFDWLENVSRPPESLPDLEPTS